MIDNKKYYTIDEAIEISNDNISRNAKNFGSKIISQWKNEI